MKPDEVPASGDGGVRDASSPTPERDEPEAAERQPQATVRLVGLLWAHPDGEYRRVTLTAPRPVASGTTLESLFPAGLHWDVAEMRRADARMTAPHTDERRELASDLPFQARATVRSAYVQLHIGGLLFSEPQDQGEAGAGSETFATGTALLRRIDLSGTIFDDRFRVGAIECSRVLLIEADRAWTGRLTQIVYAAYEGQPGRVLLQQLRAAHSFADPLALVRRAAARIARATG